MFKRGQYLSPGLPVEWEKREKRSIYEHRRAEYEWKISNLEKHNLLKPFPEHRTAEYEW
jgi:hypothetical protein